MITVKFKYSQVWPQYFSGFGVDRHLVQTKSLERRVLLSLVPTILTLSPPLKASAFVGKVTIRTELTPDQSQYDATDTQLRSAAQLLQDALNAETVEKEEELWTEIIKQYNNTGKNWTADLVGRAWGNRGNARSRQGKLEEALADYEKAIELCPWSVDPVLNRGVVFEALGRYEEAIQDYQSVLQVSPNDPAAWNNLGNANAGLGNWEEAVKFYGEAANLAPEFAFAKANQAVALYQTGKVNEAMREMRALLRRYPEFPDMRAALTASLWALGKEAEAETQWQRVEDPRYKDKVWLQTTRKWPPLLVEALSAFLDLKSVTLG